MGRIDPIATYFGAVGLVVGGLGVAIGLDREAPVSPSTVGMGAAMPVDEAATSESWRPPLAGEPVAFYGETLELIAPTRTSNEPPVLTSPAPTPAAERREPDLSPPPARERSAGTTSVVVHRKGYGAQVYRVERER